MSSNPTEILIPQDGNFILSAYTKNKYYRDVVVKPIYFNPKHPVFETTGKKLNTKIEFLYQAAVYDSLKTKSGRLVQIQSMYYDQKNNTITINDSNKFKAFEKREVYSLPKNPTRCLRIPIVAYNFTKKIYEYRLKAVYEFKKPITISDLRKKCSLMLKEKGFPEAIYYETIFKITNDKFQRSHATVANILYNKYNRLVAVIDHAKAAEDGQLLYR